MRIDPQIANANEAVGHWWRYDPPTQRGHIVLSNGRALCGNRSVTFAFVDCRPEWVPTGQENIYCCVACFAATVKADAP